MPSGGEMSTTPQAIRLRQRAATLRTLARRIESLTVLDLHRVAGADTWVGPSPCTRAEMLRAHRGRLLAAADDLWATASRFEREADELDAAALAESLSGSPPSPVRVG